MRDADAPHSLERFRAIEERLAALEARTAQHDVDLEAKVTDLIKSQLPREAFREEDCKVTVDVDPSRADDCHDLDEDNDFELSESVWEASLLAGAPGVGVLGSIFLLLIIALNLYIQVIFCSIVWTAFGSEEESVFHPAIVKEAERWRFNEAHSTDRMDKVAWASHGSRVCGNDGSLVSGNVQAGLVGERERYIKHLTVGNITLNKQGFLLAWTCLALWYLTVAGELIRGFEMMGSLCAIPHSGTRSKFVTNVENAVEVEALGWPRRVSMLLLTCIRLSIAFLLLVAGGKWLCLTTDIFDLILNAAALAFVLDCDELIYTTMAPIMLKRRMKNIAPLKTHLGISVGGLGWKSPVVLLGLAIFFFTFNSLYIQPVHERIEATWVKMCDGDRAFVVEASTSLGNAVIVSTNTMKEVGKNTRRSVMRRATEQFLGLSTKEKERLKGLPIYMQNESAVVVRTQAEFFSELQRTSDSFSSPKCRDELQWTSDKQPHAAYLEGMRSLTGRHDANNCTDFMPLCRDDSSGGVLVRTFCSRTCRCDTLATLMVDRTGCTSGCLARTQIELSVYSGRDTDSLSACYDREPTKFLMPDVKLLLESYEKRLRVQLPLEQIQQYGCMLFSRQNSEVEFWDPNSSWVPDALCGRSNGTNVAIQNVPFQSLRGLCPVSCGCSIDFSPQCPVICKEGAFRVQVDSCSLGVCPGRSLAPVQDDSFCRDLDRSFRNYEIDQTQCEALADNYMDSCCCPGAVSCDGCDAVKREQCYGTEDCFNRGSCSHCNATEECEDAECGWCSSWSQCAACFPEQIQAQLL
eukprot:TRINITY_DN14454_c0_g1_i5.p1 TRINITY_DN14454_c0_g1~~TRINITY_DN14454_c0_g1_i5.p1  ORF type:complete len:805 (-),score=87.97 TRINITY_DN14454_c0_g1_i5:246-2660(-)